MIEFWKIVQVILLSSVKFVAGPAFAYYNKQHEFTLPETVIYCVIGGHTERLVVEPVSPN